MCVALLGGADRRGGSSSRRWGANWSANNFTSHHPTRSIVRRASFAKFCANSLCVGGNQRHRRTRFAFRQVLRRWCPSKHANTIERTDIVSFVERRRLSRFGVRLYAASAICARPCICARVAGPTIAGMTAANALSERSKYTVRGKRNFAMRSHSACKRRYQPRRFFAHFQLIRHQEPFRSEFISESS